MQAKNVCVIKEDMWISAAKFGPAEEEGNVRQSLCFEMALTQRTLTPPHPHRQNSTNSILAPGSLESHAMPSRTGACPPHGWFSGQGSRHAPGLPVGPEKVRPPSRVRGTKRRLGRASFPPTLPSFLLGGNRQGEFAP